MPEFRYFPNAPGGREADPPIVPPVFSTSKVGDKCRLGEFGGVPKLEDCSGCKKREPISANRRAVNRLSNRRVGRKRLHPVNCKHYIIEAKSKHDSVTATATVEIKEEKKGHSKWETKYLSVNSDESAAHSELTRQCVLGIVEIGVLHGDTSRLFLANSTVPVFGIDPIIPDSMMKSLHGSEESIRQKTREFGLRYHFIRDYSENVVGGFDFPFDYIYIDGDHNYSAVKRDWEQWFPKLAVGGIIVFHDSAVNRGGPGFWLDPSRLVDEIMFDPRLEYLKTIRAATFFRKVG